MVKVRRGEHNYMQQRRYNVARENLRRFDDNFDSDDKEVVLFYLILDIPASFLGICFKKLLKFSEAINSTWKCISFQISFRLSALKLPSSKIAGNGQRLLNYSNGRNIQNKDLSYGTTVQKSYEPNPDFYDCIWAGNAENRVQNRRERMFISQEGTRNNDGNTQNDDIKFDVNQSLNENKHSQTRYNKKECLRCLTALQVENNGDCFHKMNQNKVLTTKPVSVLKDAINLHEKASDSNKLLVSSQSCGLSLGSCVGRPKVFLASMKQLRLKLTASDLINLKMLPLARKCEDPRTLLRGDLNKESEKRKLFADENSLKGLGVALKNMRNITYTRYTLLKPDWRDPPYSLIPATVDMPLSEMTYRRHQTTGKRFGKSNKTQSMTNQVSAKPNLCLQIPSKDQMKASRRLGIFSKSYEPEMWTLDFSAEDVELNRNNNNNKEKEKIPEIINSLKSGASTLARTSPEREAVQCEILSSPTVLRAIDHVYHLRSTNKNNHNDTKKNNAPSINKASRQYITSIELRSCTSTSVGGSPKDHESSPDNPDKRTLQGSQGCSTNSLGDVLTNAGLSEEDVGTFMTSDASIDSFIVGNACINVNPADLKEEEDGFFHGVFGHNVEETSQDMTTNEFTVAANSKDLFEASAEKQHKMTKRNSSASRSVADGTIVEDHIDTLANKDYSNPLVEDKTGDGSQPMKENDRCDDKGLGTIEIENLLETVDIFDESDCRALPVVNSSVARERAKSPDPTEGHQKNNAKNNAASSHAVSSIDAKLLTLNKQPCVDFGKKYKSDQQSATKRNASEMTSTMKDFQTVAKRRKLSSQAMNASSSRQHKVQMKLKKGHKSTNVESQNKPSQKRAIQKVKTSQKVLETEQRKLSSCKDVNQKKNCTTTEKSENISSTVGSSQNFDNQKMKTARNSSRHQAQHSPASKLSNRIDKPKPISKIDQKLVKRALRMSKLDKSISMVTRSKDDCCGKRKAAPVPSNLEIKRPVVVTKDHDDRQEKCKTASKSNRPQNLSTTTRRYALKKISHHDLPRNRTAGGRNKKDSKTKQCSTYDWKESILKLARKSQKTFNVSQRKFPGKSSSGHARSKLPKKSSAKSSKNNARWRFQAVAAKHGPLIKPKRGRKPKKDDSTLSLPPTSAQGAGRQRSKIVLKAKGPQRYCRSPAHQKQRPRKKSTPRCSRKPKHKDDRAISLRCQWFRDIIDNVFKSQIKFINDNFPD